MSAYLFVTSRDNYEKAKKHSVVGFHDYVSGLNNVLPAVKVWDKVFFYITKEMVIASCGRVSKEVYDDDSPLFDSKYQEPYSRRIGIDFSASDANVDFRYGIAPKLDLVKRKDIGYSAYLVAQFIKLSPHDEEIIGQALS